MDIKHKQNGTSTCRDKKFPLPFLTKDPPFYSRQEFPPSISDTPTFYSRLKSMADINQTVNIRLNMI